MIKKIPSMLANNYTPCRILDIQLFTIVHCRYRNWIWRIKYPKCRLPYDVRYIFRLSNYSLWLFYWISHRTKNKTDIIIISWYLFIQSLTDQIMQRYHISPWAFQLAIPPMDKWKPQDSAKVVTSITII